MGLKAQRLCFLLPQHRQLIDSVVDERLGLCAVQAKTCADSRFARLAMLLPLRVMAMACVPE